MSSLTDDIWMDVALGHKFFSTCARDQVVALMVAHYNNYQDFDVVVGNNHTPADVPACIDGGCARGAMSYFDQPAGGDYSNCVGVHAEVDMMAKAETRLNLQPLFYGEYTVYVTREPCTACWVALEEVDRVVWLASDGTLRARELI